MLKVTISPKSARNSKWFTSVICMWISIIQLELILNARTTYVADQRVDFLLNLKGKLRNGEPMNAISQKRHLRML